VKVLGIAWIGIVGAHPSTRAFYRDLLSPDLLESDEAYDYYEVGATTRLEILTPGTPSARRQRPSAPAIGFLVDDLDEAVRQLEGTSVVQAPPIHEWRSGGDRHRWIYLRDPDQNVLLLVERR
jgi:hypothetical protein